MLATRTWRGPLRLAARRLLSTLPPHTPLPAPLMAACTAAPLDPLPLPPPLSVAAAAAAEGTADPSAAAATAAEALGYWPPDLALRVVDHFHTLGLPWWAAIVGSTLLVRSAMLPLALRTTAMQAKLAALKEELAPLQARAQATGGMDPAAMREVQEVYAKHGVSPLQMLAVPLVQMPVFLSFFIGLRRLAESFPQAHEGGTLWFVDLGVADSTYALPALSGASALFLVRLAMPPPPAAATAAERETHFRMRTLMSALTLVSVPVACTMPASVLVFWVTNNLFSLAYSSAVLAPASRAALGLPPLPQQLPPPALLEAEGDAAAAAAPPSIASAQGKAAESLAQLGESLVACGKLADGAAMHRRAHALCVEAWGEEHPHSVAALCRYAEVAEMAGLHDEAIGAWRKARPLLPPPPQQQQDEQQQLQQQAVDPRAVDERLAKLEALRGAAAQKAEAPP